MMRRTLSTSLTATLRRARIPQQHQPQRCRLISASSKMMSVVIEQTKVGKAPKVEASSDDQQEERVLKASCGDVSDVDDDEDEMEEMFVDAHSSLGLKEREWGGPRRGGRLPEPTRFGDWERKGRCSDF